MAAATGSSSKGFDFASDDILCSLEDYANQGNNASHSAKDFRKTSVFPDESGNQQVIIAAVDRSMKKYTDNLMRFLEGISSRLSQLELYCYNLDKSIRDMRSDLTSYHGESDAKLKFLEKHLQEVHRSVQILRDKQELADTQKELAKLQLAKESSSQQEERSSTPDTKNNDNAADSRGQQLALVPAPLPQMAPQPQLAQQPQMAQQHQMAPQSQMAPQQMSQPQGYYMPPAPAQLNQSQYPQSQVAPPQPQLQYQQQQQWAQQGAPQPPMQPGSRPSSPQVYPPYHQNQSVSPSPSEPIPNSMPLQMPYSAIPPPGSSQPGAYAFGGPVRTSQPQQQVPQHLKPAFGGQAGDGYAANGPPNAYMMYDNESGRVQHPSQQAGAGHFYSPNLQQTSDGGGGMMSRPTQQLMRNHPYNELIDKLVSMGYHGDHVMSVIQSLDETGQTVDFNAVLDRLNGHSSGGSQRGWSG